MSNSHDKLYSNDESEIVDALHQIRGSAKRLSDSKLKGRILEFLNHDSERVRVQAIILVGIKWRDGRIYETLLQMIDTTKTGDHVLQTVCSALGTLVMSGSGSRVELSKLLMDRILRSENTSIELKKTAYVVLLRINKMIKINDYARLGANLSLVNIDNNVLDEIEAKIAS